MFLWGSKYSQNTLVRPQWCTYWGWMSTTTFKHTSIFVLMKKTCAPSSTVAPLKRWRGDAFTEKTGTHLHSCSYTAKQWEDWRVCVMSNIAQKLLYHISNWVQDTSWALWWPSLAGSLMTSTMLAQTQQWFPLRTGLFDLSAELVERVGQGEGPAGQPTSQTCDELWLIATDSIFKRISFLLISYCFFFYSPSFFCCVSLRGGMEAEVFLYSNHKLRWCWLM